jgi:hypothetical protein
MQFHEVLDIIILFHGFLEVISFFGITAVSLDFFNQQVDDYFVVLKGLKKGLNA